MQKRALLHGSEGSDTASGHPHGCGATAREALGKLHVKVPQRLLTAYQLLAEARGQKFTAWVTDALANHFLSQVQRGDIAALARRIVMADFDRRAMRGDGIGKQKETGE